MNVQSKFLALSDGSRLYPMNNWSPDYYKNFLNKMTLVMGMSGSGKSTIMDEVLESLVPYIPLPFAISPTNASNKFFDGKFPAKHIISGHDTAEVIRFLENLLRTQKYRCELYNIANDFDLLRAVSYKHVTASFLRSEKNITEKCRIALELLDKSQKSVVDKRKEKKHIEDLRVEFLKKHYKQHIRLNEAVLLTKPLTEKERMVVEYVDLNPNILLVMDDCASRFKEWSKKTTAFKQIFYEGRQWYFTTIINFQDDKEIDSSLRKGSMVTFLTTDQIALSNFTRVSNGYGKATGEIAKKCIEAVFKQEGKKNYRRLVYITGTQEPFRYIEARIVEPYKMGAPVFWKLSERLNAAIQENNPLVKPMCVSYKKKKG